MVSAVELLLKDPILDYLDAKCGCNTLEYLLSELVKQNLLNEQKSKELFVARDCASLTLSKIELNGQQPSLIKVVKQTSSPLSGILKALDGDYNKMQEALLSLLCQALSGTSFDLILSVATVEGKLKIFVSRLIRCNESSKEVAGEVDKPAAIRAALFDVSFLMLAFIVQTYGSEVTITTIGNESFSFMFSFSLRQAVLGEAGDSFFEKWVREFMIEPDKIKSPNGILQKGDQSKIDEFIANLGEEKGLAKALSTLKWQDACMNIPGILHQILIAWENKAITIAEVRTFFDNLKSKLCCLSVCAASWLRMYMRILRQDELAKPMDMIEQISTVAAQEAGQQQEFYKERSSLTLQIVRKIQADIAQNQKARMIGFGVISQQPLEEQFVDTWKTVLDLGWLSIECAQIFENLLKSCGPFWLVSKLVNEILHCKFSKDMKKYSDIVFAIMHLNIERCSVALLSDLLPMLLINKTQ